MSERQAVFVVVGVTGFAGSEGESGRGEMTCIHRQERKGRLWLRGHWSVVRDKRGGSDPQ
jgi:hypothetical protein